jgi:hypothetical protein
MLDPHDSELISLLQRYAQGDESIRPLLVSSISVVDDRRASEILKRPPLTQDVAMIMVRQLKLFAPEITTYFQEWIPIIEVALVTGHIPTTYLNSGVIKLDKAIAEARNQRKQLLQRLFPECDLA